MPRHWERIEKITACTFDVENENFQLRNIMEAPLLENKEDIEVGNVITSSDVIGWQKPTCFNAKCDVLPLCRIFASAQ